MQKIDVEEIKKAIDGFQVEECPSMVIRVSHEKVKGLEQAYEKYEISKGIQDDAVFLVLAREDVLFPGSKCISFYYQLSESALTMSLGNILLSFDDKRPIEQIIIETINNAIENKDLEWEWIVKKTYGK